jgi:hypothetical protein
LNSISVLSSWALTKLSEDDRQCAWELYSEIVTRVAVVGKRRDTTCEDFSGELYAESLDSLYNFFKECRGIMRKFPVGKLKEYKQEHLGVLINRILNDVFRPFLEKWSGPRQWRFRPERPAGRTWLGHRGGAWHDPGHADDS